MSEHAATPQFAPPSIPSVRDAVRNVTGYWWVLLTAGIAWVAVALAIAEGIGLVEEALRSRRFGPYTLQAAIAAVHAEAGAAGETDWRQIVGLYDVLLRAEPSPVVELNRAAAVAMRDGPAAGLALIDALLARGDLAGYHLAHSARADLCRRLGMTDSARDSYRRALELASQEVDRRFLARRLAELDA